MTNIDPAIVEAALRDVPYVNRDGEGCAHRIYGPCAACEAGALAPLIAAAVDAARAEGDKQGAARVREAVEACLPPLADTHENMNRVLNMYIQDWWKVSNAIRAALTEAAPHE